MNLRQGLKAPNEKDKKVPCGYLRLKTQNEDHALQIAMLVLSSHVHIDQETVWTFFILILSERQ